MIILLQVTSFFPGVSVAVYDTTRIWSSVDSAFYSPWENKI